MIRVEFTIGRRHLFVLVGILAIAVLAVPGVSWAAGRFDDVPDDSVFVADIEWLADAGITKGCNPPANTRFCPGSNVTREQMAAFMHRLSGGDDRTIDGRLDALEAENERLKALLAGVSRDGDTLLFDAMNLQVVNGEGATDTTNGLGNLIVGYNAKTVDEERSGSHYLVVGDRHSYTSFGGAVVGLSHTASGDWASVTGGFANTASNDYSSVAGGTANTASGPRSSVAGGFGNIAFGLEASVVGGFDNLASGVRSSVSGGVSNESEGNYSVVSGGENNTASGYNSSASGGTDNTADGEHSSVSGGSLNQAIGVYASISGGASNTATEEGASVTGGNSNQATEIFSSVSGGFNNIASGNSASVSGGASNVAGVGTAASVSGGYDNDASGDYTSILGGYSNFLLDIYSHFPN